MNNQGLLALAQLILPSEILSNFEVVRVEEKSSLIQIHLDEAVKTEYKAPQCWIQRFLRSRDNP